MASLHVSGQGIRKLANEGVGHESRRCSEIGVSFSGGLLPQRVESRKENFVGHEFWRQQP